MKKWNQRLSAAALSTAITVVAMLSAMPKPAEAQASAPSTTPSMKIGTAALIDPTLAKGFYGTATAHGHSYPTYTTPNEIVELARSLNSNVDAAGAVQSVDLVYEFVRNNIDVTWMYGLQKGALGALVDRSGTPFDQAALMVELLEQLGYTASYQSGTITLTAAQFSAWTGLSNARAACQLLSSGGIPAVINGSTPASCTSYDTTATVTSVQLSHIWVQVAISGTNYVFDPSYKPYTVITGANLAAAASFTSGQALSAAVPAQSGTTTTTGVSYATNLNATALNSRLQTYGQNLLAYIQTSLPNALLQNLVGGSVITPFITPTGGLRQTALPYTAAVTDTWGGLVTNGVGSIPDQYRTRLGVQITKVAAATGAYVNIVNQNLFVDEIYGRKLNFITNGTATVTFQGSLQLVDEFGHTQTIQTSTSADNPAYSLGYVTLTATHPYAASANGTQTPDGTYMTETTTKYARYLAPFTIVHGWGDVGLGGINEKWGTRLDNVQTSLPAGGCEQCVGSYFGNQGDGRREQLAASWLAQVSRASRLHAAIAHAVFTHHHSIGIVAANSTLAAGFKTVAGTGPGPQNQYGVVDSYDRIDVDSAISVTSATANAADRRAAIHAIAATSEALEGSVVAQVADLPDTSSTAARFAWGNAPPTAEDPFGAAAGTVKPRPFYQFNPGGNYSGTQLSALITQEGAATGRTSDSNQDQTECFVDGTFSQVWANRLAAGISDYADAGSPFQVVASGESFLGPGQRCGAFDPSPDFPDGTGYRWPSLQRGGALIANRYDANGDPLEIAHIVISYTDDSKGGGGGVQSNQQAQYDPSTAADVLKSRFIDRSKVLGVDLQSGKVSATSGAALTVGNGGFPYALSAQLIWRGGDKQTTTFGPISHVQPNAPWTTNWNNTLTVSSSALEQLGDDDIRTTAGTVAAFMALQDVYRSAPSAQREVTGELVSAWWVQGINGDVVTANVGTDTRQFVNATPWLWQTPSAATWIPTGAGAYAKLQVSGSRTVFTDACGGNANLYKLTRGWDSSSMSFAVTNAHGDVQNWAYWTKDISDPASSGYCARQKGFRLNNWVFPQGVTVSLAYSAGTAYAPPDLLSVGNTLGRVINFTDSGLGGFTSGNDSRGVIVTPPNDGGFYPNEPAGSSATIIHTDPVGDVSQFTTALVNGKYLLQYVYTPDNQSTPALGYTYDSLLRVKTASDAVTLQQGGRPAYQFNIAEGLRGERIDPLGARYTVYYDNRKRPLQYIDELGHVTAMTHDGRGRVTTTTYPIGVSQQVPGQNTPLDQEVFTYDDHNNTTSLTKWPYTSGVPGQPVNLSITAQWDQTWNKPQWIKDAKGQETDFTYHTSDNGVSLVYTATQPAVSDPVSGTTKRPVWTFTYNTLGQPATVTDPTGVVTQNVYYSANNYLFTTTVDPGSAPHVNSLTTYNSYDAAGDALIVTDPDNHATTTTYDTDRRALTVTPPTGICGKTENTYRGGLLVEVRKAKVCAPNESDTSTVSDSNWAVTLYAFTPTHKPWITLDPNLYNTFTAYDGDDRATDVTQCLTGDTVPRGSCLGASRTTHTTYYADGQVNQVFKGWGSADQITYSATTYDKDDKPLSVADANGNVTRSVYDGYERLFRLCYPDSTAASCTVAGSPTDYEQYTYDLNSNLTTKQNRDGKQIVTAFDALNREISSTVPLNAAGHFQRVLSSTYDLAGRKWDIGVTDSETGTPTSQTLSHRYDTAGRLTSVDDSYLAGLFNSACATGTSRCFGSVAATYDAAGNLKTQLLYGAGGTTSYTENYNYDAANRLLTLSDSLATHASYTAYDPLGRLTAATWGNSSRTGWAFQDNGDLSVLNTTIGTTTTGWNLTHNGAHQIIGETLSDNSFEMQAGIPNTTYAVNSLNQYTAVNSATPSYDKDGNLTGDGTWTYEYDEENRLRRANGPSSVLYDYDPLGRRRYKLVGTVPTYYTSDGTEEVAEWGGTGALTTRYLNGLTTDDHVAMLDYSSACATAPATPCRYYYHTDWHGSTIMLSDASQAVSSANKYQYGPYGESTNGVLGNPFRYTGRRLDPETGLYYYRARYYDPRTGRFLQTDPIGPKDNLNLYGYVSDDPFNNTDPSGLCADGSDPPTGTRICPSSTSEGSGGKSGGTLEQNKINARAAEKSVVDELRAAGKTVIEKVSIRIFPAEEGGESILAIADYAYVEGKMIILGEIKDGQGGRFSPNQKSVYEAAIKGDRFEFSPEGTKALNLIRGENYAVRALTVNAAAGSRVLRQTARIFGVEAKGALSIMRIGGAAAGAASVVLDLVWPSELGANDDCPGCLVNGVQ